MDNDEDLEPYIARIRAMTNAELLTEGESAIERALKDQDALAGGMSDACHEECARRGLSAAFARVFERINWQQGGAPPAGFQVPNKKGVN